MQLQLTPSLVTAEVCLQLQLNSMP